MIQSLCSAYNPPAVKPKLPAPYLSPYLRAATLYGDGFGSLLWASPETQAVRFDAIQRLGDLGGKSVLDVGCGRADLYDFLHARGIQALHLQVRPDNPALRLYQRSGFVVSPRVVMTRRL